MVFKFTLHAVDKGARLSQLLAEAVHLLVHAAVPAQRAALSQVLRSRQVLKRAPSTLRNDTSIP